VLSEKRRAQSREYSRRYRLKHPERTQKYNAEAHKDRRERMASLIANWKLDNGCYDCGDRWQLVAGEDPDALEFDHLNPEDVKRHPSGRRVNWKRRSFSEILDELKKVDVVCAICHSLRSAGAYHEVVYDVS